MTTTFKIDPTKTITWKQFTWLRDLAAGKDWSQAPTDVSITIKKVTRFKSELEGDVPEDVRRLAASQAINFLLKIKTPTTPSSTPGFTSAWANLANILAELPLSKYAVEREDEPGVFDFYEVVERKTTKKRYLNRLLGCPGDWKRVFISAAQGVPIAELIKIDPAKFATLYCQKFTRCSCCDAPLSDAKSIAQSMGPVCSKKFKW